METIRWGKEMGAKVTCEVAPHHLLFNEEDYWGLRYKL